MCFKVFTLFMLESTTMFILYQVPGYAKSLLALWEQFHQLASAWLGCLTLCLHTHEVLISQITWSPPASMLCTHSEVFCLVEFCSLKWWWCFYFFYKNENVWIDPLGQDIGFLGQSYAWTLFSIAWKLIRKWCLHSFGAVVFWFFVPRCSILRDCWVVVTGLGHNITY
jgi:hypothetical protein